MGWAGTALEVGGGLASANVGALTSIALTPRALAAQGARGGAAGGALAGFGSGEGLQDTALKTVTGGAGGAALGAGLGALAGRYAPRGMDPDLAAASQAENVSLIRPMVDPASRGRMGGLESTPVGQPIIRQGLQRVTGEIEQGVARAGGPGAALEPGAAGERLQIAGNRYITRSRGVSNQLYARAERQAGNTEFLPENAIRQANEELQTLAANPETNAAEIAFIEGLRSDLAQPKTVAALRDLRTSIRGRIGTDNLTMTQAEARAVRILDAAADDVQAAAPQAASAYRRADAFYRERMVMVDDVKNAILGKRGAPMDPQQAFKNIKNLTAPGANGRRLAAIMRHLGPDERNDIAATVAQALGRDSADGPFSPARFLSQTSSSKFSPSALRTVFGPDGAQSIANLRLLSRRLTEAGGDINRSRTSGGLFRGGVRQVLMWLTGMGGVGGAAAGSGTAMAAAAVGGTALAGSAVRQALSARALMNPRVSRWLAEAANVNTPTQAQQAVRRLGVIAAREPQLAVELNPVQQYLQKQLTASAAASPDVEGGDNEQR
jgi:hypothetical protein